MPPAIRKLYLFHFFNSLALTTVANFVFLDPLLLRLDLNMSQIGTVKGVALWVAMTLNLLLSPVFLRARVDQWVVGIGYLARVALPFGFLLLPRLELGTEQVTLWCSLLLTLSLVPVSLANNSMAALLKANIPEERLGWTTSIIWILWNLPYYVAAVACSWYVDRHAGGTDAEFFGAMFVVFTVTAVFQLPATAVILTLRTNQESPPPAARLTAILEPFRDAGFRPWLNAVLVLTAVSTMVTSFLNPYLIQARGMSLSRIALLALAGTLVSMALIPLWGRMADRFGGRNILRLCNVGVAAAIFCLVGPQWWLVLVFTALGWQAAGGVFGSGLAIGQQYLTLTLAQAEKSNIYFAVVAFVTGIGSLVGAVVGGFLLDWLAARMNPTTPFDHYRIYFTYCGLGFLLLGQFVGALRERHEEMSSVKLASHMIRTVLNTTNIRRWW